VDKGIVREKVGTAGKNHPEESKLEMEARLDLLGLSAMIWLAFQVHSQWKILSFQTLSIKVKF
jgi:hypothetical protein